MGDGGYPRIVGMPLSDDGLGVAGKHPLSRWRPVFTMPAAGAGDTPAHPELASRAKGAMRKSFTAHPLL